jgi:hypothetical protein
VLKATFITHLTFLRRSEASVQMRTRSRRIAGRVFLVLPWHNPVLLAEQVAEGAAAKHSESHAPVEGMGCSGGERV